MLYYPARFVPDAGRRIDRQAMNSNAATRSLSRAVRPRARILGQSLRYRCWYRTRNSRPAAEAEAFFEQELIRWKHVIDVAGIKQER